jgi:hypothetical protein
VRVPDREGTVGTRGGLRVPTARGHERGAVTAETMMVIPVLLAIGLGLSWLLALAATQVRVVDAAREVARATARDEDHGDARALGRRVAPDGSRITIRDDGPTVVVDVVADVDGPGPLFAFLPSVAVHAQSVALRESP